MDQKLMETMVACERCGKPVRERDVVTEVDISYYRMISGKYPKSAKIIYVCPECADKE